MPELPEVERARRLLERAACGRRIVWVHSARDPIVFDGVTAPGFTRALRGRAVLNARRRGKHLWLELDRRPWPCFHLGMTGQVRELGDTPLSLASSPRIEDDQWPPRFTKLHLRLDDGAELAVTNKRRLGRIRLRDDPATEPPISGLGFDPLLDPPSRAQFADRLRRRSGVIKSVLLDQSFAAGVGNWIADEVLYQAKIDPHREANRLTEVEVSALRTKLQLVVQTAVAVDADKSRFPRTWLFHRRWGRNPDASVGGQRIKHVTIGGRTTAWVPTRQR